MRNSRRCCDIVVEPQAYNEGDRGIGGALSPLSLTILSTYAQAHLKFSLRDRDREVVLLCGNVVSVAYGLSDDSLEICDRRDRRVMEVTILLAEL